jgi:hypothetical protein
MKTTLTAFTAALALATGFAAEATAASAQAPASAAAPRLADGVKRQAGYEAPPRRYVLATPTPIFTDTSPYSMPNGSLDQVGQPVEALAKVQGWEWILVGRNGVGVGYVPISLLTTTGA